MKKIKNRLIAVTIAAAMVMTASQTAIGATAASEVTATEAQTESSAVTGSSESAASASASTVTSASSEQSSTQTTSTTESASASTETAAASTETTSPSNDTTSPSTETPAPSTETPVSSTETQTVLSTESASELTTEAGNENSSEFSTETSTEKLDYVLGRPLTEEEKAKEAALEPALRDLPQDHYNVPELADEIDALGVSDSQQAVAEAQNILQKSDSVSSVGSGSLASVYDPRPSGLVTPVREQSGNSCWAYSSIGAGEQSLLYQGVKLPDGQASASTLDLSEGQLLYFFYHSVPDPLGNTAGDSTVNTSSLSYIDVGSSTIFSTFTLANWIGAADESAVSMDALDESSKLSDSLAYTADKAHLKNAYWINFKDTDAVNSIKQMIQQYGGVAINLYYNRNYFNSDTKAYYYPLNMNQSNNHSVTIVGWDDNYSKDNFTGTKPASNGAWIVKNSYGTSWGDQGYFYISYQDSSVNTNNTNVNRARAYVFDFDTADNYDYNYQYDGTSGAYNCSYPNSANTVVTSGSSVANVFRATSLNGNQKQVLKAVSIALYDTAVDYSIQIYRNPTDEAVPSSGTPVLSVPQTGSTSYVGYYTIPLNEQVELSEGDTFAVVFTLSKASGNDINFFVDASYQNSNWVSFVNQTKSGQSFRQTATGWQDLSTLGMSARIKAFTDDYVVPATSLSWNMDQSDAFTKEADGNYTLTLWNDEALQMRTSILPANATNQSLTWTSSKESVLKIDDQGNLIPVDAGKSVITATTKDGTNLSVSVTVTVRIRSTGLKLGSKSLSMTAGETTKLKATVSPSSASGNTVKWNSSDQSVATVSSDGTITAVGAGTAVITAKMKDNAGITAKCTVTVSAAPVTAQITSDSTSVNGGISIDRTQSSKSSAIRSGGALTSDTTPIAQYLLLLLLGLLLVVDRIKKILRF